MKKYIVVTLSVILIVAGLFILSRVLASIKPAGVGALQVTSNIKASVYLDEKLIGATNLCKCNPGDTIKEGEYSLRIVPQDTSLSPFTLKIQIKPGVLTAVERTFLPGSLASAYILTLDKISSKDPELLVTSIPDGALVSLDGEAQGATPFQEKKVSASEHELEVQKQGFGKKTLKIRTVPAYRLVAQILLGTELSGDDALLHTPTPAPSAAPSETPTVTIKIKSTPNGFLRVREEATTASREITRVLPDETFPLVAEETGWYQIKLATGESGWVSSTYAEKVTGE